MRYYNIVKFLIKQHSINLNQRNHDDISPLILAAIQDDIKMVKILLTQSQIDSDMTFR